MQDEQYPIKPTRGRLLESTVGTVICFCIPPVLYILTYSLLSFSFRHDLGLAISSKFQGDSILSGALVSFLLVPLPLACLSCVVVMLGVYRFQRGRNARCFANTRPSLLLCLGICCCVAVTAGALCGDRNYWLHTALYYNIEDLNTYVAVNPSTERGQSYLDAGQIYFKENTHVAVDVANALRNKGVYCVAPIVQQPLRAKPEGAFIVPPSGSIDFWAVGMNCCDSSGRNFACAGARDPAARSGMRLVRDDEKPYFDLAVQEWSAKFEMPAKNPQFFYFVADPVQEHTATYRNGCWAFFGHSMSFVAFNAALVFFLQVVFRKIGVR